MVLLSGTTVASKGAFANRRVKLAGLSGTRGAMVCVCQFLCRRVTGRTSRWTASRLTRTLESEKYRMRLWCGLGSLLKKRCCRRSWGGMRHRPCTFTPRALRFCNGRMRTCNLCARRDRTSCTIWRRVRTRVTMLLNGGTFESSCSG